MRVMVGLAVYLPLAFTPRASWAQLGVTATASGTLFVHQVDIGYGVEESTGLLFGAEGVVKVRSRLALAVHAAGGSLYTQSAGAQDRNVGEIGARASVLPGTWLALFVSGTSRTYSSVLARQRWTTLEVGAEAHADFVTIPVRAVLRGGFLPVVSVRGLPGPDVALAAGAGLEYRGAVFTGGMFYGLERYDFPDVGAGRRVEQVSTLSFQLSVRRPRR